MSLIQTAIAVFTLALAADVERCSGADDGETERGCEVCLIQLKLKGDLAASNAEQIQNGRTTDAYSGEYRNKYLAGYACGARTDLSSLSEAQSLCDTKGSCCGGVTKVHNKCIGAASTLFSAEVPDAAPPI